MASKRIKVVLASLEDQGCVIVDKTSGWQIRFPNGEMTMIHRSESDRRAENNTRAYVKRAGLTWPFDGQQKGKK